MVKKFAALRFRHLQRGQKKAQLPQKDRWSDLSAPPVGAEGVARFYNHLRNLFQSRSEQSFAARGRVKRACRVNQRTALFRSRAT